MGYVSLQEGKRNFHWLHWSYGLMEKKSALVMDARNVGGYTIKLAFGASKVVQDDFHQPYDS